ncbi:extracellular solute-binding protein [Pseudaminobacter soli (ex Li et al. 2025)]|uniref:extracellular solute-binding protein n=1 Tax=Pseudaminobacter soli (ex Li et al. 2025) TaxID=1295366 RepID=UPI0015E712A2|nr:extracellular solute-binding protein [Mesorhizobium soli]
MKRLALLAMAATAFATGASAAERTKFEFWYGLTGDLGEVVANHCKLFNESQDKYEAICTGQGGYDKAEQNTIAAFRAKQHPTVVQIYDAGTVNFMLSGAIYPANKFAKDYNLDIDWSKYFPGIANYYATSKGEMWSFPYNSSTAVLYWNKDAWAKIGKDKAPATWAEFGEDLKALKAAGVDCGFAFDFDSWMNLEQFSAINGIPLATLENGYGGLGAEIAFNKTAFVDHMKDFKAWMDAGYARIQTNQTGKNLIQSFADGTCASTTSSIANHGTVHNTQVAGLNWDVAKLPVIDASKRTNSIVGGASLWVMEGKSKEEYEAAAAFLKYVTAPDTGEKYIAENTGYIPVTTAGFELLKSEGFYNDPKRSGRETAIESLTASDVTPLSRGIRLGNFTSIRAEVRSELEAAFAGQKTVEQAIDAAADRSNQILRRYEQTFKGKTLP